jgi:hypothetical protein
VNSAFPATVFADEGKTLGSKSPPNATLSTPLFVKSL